MPQAATGDHSANIPVGPKVELLFVVIFGVFDILTVSSLFPLLSVAFFPSDLWNRLIGLSHNEVH